MELDRKKVESLLLQCGENETDYLNFYISGVVMAELCRAWLALDAAPEGFVEEEVSGLVVYTNRLKKGQAVRLVAVSGEE